MPYVLLPTGGANSGLDSPTEMLDDYADDGAEDRLTETRLAEDHLAEARLAEARQAEHQTERQTEPQQVWILFRGDTEPLPLDDLTLAQDMRLEQGWPYTYVKPPGVKNVKSPHVNN